MTVNWGDEVLECEVLIVTARLPAFTKVKVTPENVVDQIGDSFSCAITSSWEATGICK